MTESPRQDFTTDEVVDQIVDELQPDLRRFSPQEGINRYIQWKSEEVTANTIKDYRRRLELLHGFLQDHGISDLRDLDGYILDDYRQWRRYSSSDDGAELSQKTMRDEMYLVRDLVAYLENIEAVEPGLSDKISIPELKDGNGVRDIELDSDRMTDILAYLRQYQYASLGHVSWELKSKTGRRTGGLIGLDVEDAVLDAEQPFLKFRHRPPETRLKNGTASEGKVSIPETTAAIVADYIDNERPKVTDEDRKPLLATNRGRISSSAFRRIVYRWSRPCAIGKACPHDKDPDNCEAAQSLDTASKCPSSRSPHAIRHGHVSECRRKGLPIEIIADRIDCQPDTIRTHYDESTQEERFEIRQELLDELTEDSGGGYL